MATGGHERSELHKARISLTKTKTRIERLNRQLLQAEADRLKHEWAVARLERARMGYVPEYITVLSGDKVPASFAIKTLEKEETE